MTPLQEARCNIGLILVTIATQVLTVLGATPNNVVSAITPNSISESTATVITLTVGGGGPIGVGDVCEFAANCGSVGTPNLAVGANQVTVTVGAPVVGLKLCYRKAGQADAVEQVGVTGGLTVIAATPNNKFTSISPPNIYANTAYTISLGGVTGGIAGDKAIFAQDCSTAVPNVALATGSPSLTSFTVTSTGGGFKLCLRNAGGSDSVEQLVISLTVSAVGGVGADPVTWFGDQVRVFSLPVNKLLPMMSATDMTLHGETFMYGGPWQQWFGRLVLASPAGDRWVQIAVKKNILEFNRSRAVKGHFETLEVTLGHGSFDEPTVTTIVPGPDAANLIPLNFLGFDVHFWKMARNARAANTMIGSAHRECMEVAGANVHFYVCSSPAHEFYGHQRDLSVQYAHLDLAIIEVIDGEHLTGTLPELWGMQPMSEETEKLIVKDDETQQSTLNQIKQMGAATGKAPSKDVLVGLSLPSLPNGSLPAGKGWAGGLGFKDLENSCKQGNTTVLACGANAKENETVLTV